DPEVATANVHRLAACDRLDDPAAIAVGAVDPVVEPPDKTVEAMLLIPLDKPGEEHLLHVRLAFAIRVLGVKYVRGTRDEYALAPRQDAGRIADVVEEHGRLVVMSVTLRRFEELDSPTRLPLPVHAERVVAHLDNPQLPVRPPGDRDGVLHQRLGSGQFNTVAPAAGHQFQRLFRRLRGRIDGCRALVERPPVALAGSSVGPFLCRLDGPGCAASR